MLHSVLGSVLLLLTSLALLQPTHSLNPQVLEVDSYKKLRSWKSSSLYQVLPQGQSTYQYNPYLLYAEGSRYDIGYSYGYLLADEIKETYNTFMGHLIGTKWYDKVIEAVIGEALDWQWNDYLSKELPQQYKDELRGLNDGGVANGCGMCGRLITRTIVLANAPGDLKDFIYVLINEFNNSASFLAKGPTAKATSSPNHCSMFAIWGSRTVDSNLFSARNLDWNQDSGINKHKVILVTKPNDGATPSVSFTFACLYTTLAGMSAEGLSVHEANLEENEISFSGFPFVLRLRYIMEYANGTKSGRRLWEATNNTVGFNHMIASAGDASDYANGNKEAVVAYAMETMHGYTAYFKDNDPREANAMYKPDPRSDVVVRIGAPLTEAVWRTNHGYDPKIRAHFQWSQAPSSWSVVRYNFIHNALMDYQLAGKKIGFYEAINITAIVGDKGSTHPYSCDKMPDGTNILSVTYQPKDAIAYVAYESSTGSTWKPAVCSSYIKINFTDWFKGHTPN